MKSNSNFFMDLTNIEGIECLECFTLFTEVASKLSGNLHLFCTQLCKGKKKKKKLKMWQWRIIWMKPSCLFVLHCLRSREKGLMWTVRNLFNCICFVKRIVCLVCTHAIEIGRGFLPLIANTLFVSINFSLETIRYLAIIWHRCFTVSRVNTPR